MATVLPIGWLGMVSLILFFQDSWFVFTFLSTHTPSSAWPLSLSLFPAHSQLVSARPRDNIHHIYGRLNLYNCFYAVRATARFYWEISVNRGDRKFVCHFSRHLTHRILVKWLPILLERLLSWLDGCNAYGYVVMNRNIKLTQAARIRYILHCVSVDTGHSKCTATTLCVCRYRAQ